MRQKHSYNYFAFNQSYLAGAFASWGKIKIHHLTGPNRTGSDWWFSKILRTGLDRIQFYWIRTGPGLKNFTVRSSLSVITRGNKEYTWPTNWWIIFMYFLEYWLKNIIFRQLVNSMQNQVQSTKWHMAINQLMWSSLVYFSVSCISFG